ncbi:NAC domain-containing protein 74 [Platanthera zijinensis]|uniref:NAC domain-containing protein 74 n=1 Tax=Platanthera zijinensis TaxID=2320716 RepID=A0AAP0G5W2_9ASPA
MDALKSIALPPGFGFHPTDVELISHYLKRKNLGQKVDFDVIPELDIYKCEPWDLPACCQIPTRDDKWHFFTCRDRKYPNGTRSNRATEAGYWKSTGKDRNIRFHNRVIGTKKTLVFHEGRPPYGKRTDWIMHEYFVAEKESKRATGMKDSYVLCRVTKRNGFEVEGENVSARIDSCQKDLKDLDASMDKVVEKEESSLSESAEDLDLWFKELFDPNFDGAIDLSFTGPPASIEEESLLQGSQTGPTGALIPKDEPLDLGFLPEEILGILRDDLTAMPEITELLSVEQSSAMSHNQPSNFTGDDFSEEVPDFSVNDNFTGIQIRARKERPASEAFLHHVKLQVRTSKMESRNIASIRQTVKCAQIDRCISSSKLEVDKYTSSRGTKKKKHMQGIMSACMIGSVALIIYFLFRDCLRIFGNIPALGL